MGAILRIHTTKKHWSLSACHATALLLLLLAVHNKLADHDIALSLPNQRKLNLQFSIEFGKGYYRPPTHAQTDYK